MSELRWLVLLAGLSGFTTVAIGAMGSHSLPKRLAAQGFTEVEVAKKIEQCEIATRYQMFHTLAILAIGVVPVARSRKDRLVACCLFLVGILFFSGGLYSMVFFDRIGHWSIVPLGGGIWLVAWLTLAIGSFFADKTDKSPGKQSPETEY